MIEFRDVYTDPEAARRLYELCLERREENATNISFKVPTWEEHQAFVARRPFDPWLFALEGDVCHGYVSLTPRNEIGIVLFRRSRGRGIGSQMLRKFLREHQPLPAIPGERRGSFIANINPGNIPSIKLFASAGFRHVQNTYALD